jgi:hypothetical protein
VSGDVLIVGAGPAGLAAAERLAVAGCTVRVFERMPSPARKFLLAGRGGLNLTHSEPPADFVTRYGGGQAFMAPLLGRFPPSALADWSAGLGEPTFIGSSGRVFPKGFKASPLLRAWLRRLDALGVRVTYNRRWTGWERDGRAVFASRAGETFTERADAVLLALGGASWPRLGSDGGWVPVLARHGVGISPLRASNMGVEVPWSPHLRQRFSGAPLKGVALSCGGATVRGEAMVTTEGLEGGAVYALSPVIRETVGRDGFAELRLDLRPAEAADALLARLAAVPRKLSLSNRLRRAMALAPVALALMHEADRQLSTRDDPALIDLIKSLPLTLTGIRPIERAISTAGGVKLDAVDGHLMLKTMPGVFVAGEMLDWEAPTGGYLLQGVFSTAHAAADGIMAWLAKGQEEGR